MKMLRTLDLTLSSLGLLVGSPLFLILLVAGFWDTGNPVFVQTRVGRDGKLFRIYKFRTMRVGTESIATHLVDASSVTRWGRVLRVTKLDELPQLWNVIKGDMSLVGPRPCLPGQLDVLRERSERGVLNARPGITGLAQLSGVDMSTPKRLAEMDERMLASFSVTTYLRYLFLTALGRGSRDSVIRDS